MQIERIAFGVSLVCLGLAGAGQRQVAGWMVDCSGLTIPRTPAFGMIHGTRFAVEKAELDGSSKKDDAKTDHGTFFLHLREGKGFFADREFLIFIATKLNDRLDGKLFVVRPGPTFHQANMVRGANADYPPIQGVHMNYRVSGRSLPEIEMFSDNFSLRLVFGKAVGGKLPGAIYLCAGDKMHSYAAGTFMAVPHKL